MTNTHVTPTQLKFDRTKFQIRDKFGGFIVSESLYSDSKLVSERELGIVYASHSQALQAIDSLVRLWKTSHPGIAIEWAE